MREILFRGKAKDGEWVEGHLICKYDSDAGSYTRFEIIEHAEYSIALEYDTNFRQLHPVLVKEETVGQYTGLTDKNGQKIFEGDVVHMRTSGLSGHGEIVYKDGSFGIEDKKRNRFYYMYHDAVYRVDGNIHDNPELLEGGAS